MEKFDCEQCGACCRYHNCKYLKDNKCTIYDTRPDRCRVDKQYELNKNVMSRKEYYSMVKKVCRILQERERLTNILENFYDKKYAQEREAFRND